MACNCQTYSAQYPIPTTQSVTGITLPGVGMVGGIPVPSEAYLKHKYASGLAFLKQRVGPISVGVAIVGVLAALLVIRYKKTGKVLFEAPKVRECVICGNDISDYVTLKGGPSEGKAVCNECLNGSPPKLRGGFSGTKYTAWTFDAYIDRVVHGDIEEDSDLIYANAVETTTNKREILKKSRQVRAQWPELGTGKNKLKLDIIAVTETQYIHGEPVKWRTIEWDGTDVEDLAEWQEGEPEDTIPHSGVPLVEMDDLAPVIPKKKKKKYDAPKTADDGTDIISGKELVKEEFGETPKLVEWEAYESRNRPHSPRESSMEQSRQDSKKYGMRQTTILYMLDDEVGDRLRELVDETGGMFFTDSLAEMENLSRTIKTESAKWEEHKKTMPDTERHEWLKRSGEIWKERKAGTHYAATKKCPMCKSDKYIQQAKDVDGKYFSYCDECQCRLDGR